ncbi:holin [Salinicoccus sp. HZC-1]|uniref:holin n=1 Tax=Salinicoccus sp. HZC-1 TaxID=3385497 RepID=UPI00398AC278
METIIIFAGVISVLTVALVQLIKKTTTVPDKLMPLVSLFVGLLVGAIALVVPEITADLSVGGHLLAGGISGLSASGLYDIATKTNRGFKDTEK